MDPPNLRDLLSISDAAKMVGVSPATLRRWDRSGKFKAIKHPISNFRLYRREELQAFLRLLDPKVNRSGPRAGKVRSSASASPDRRKGESPNTVGKLKKSKLG